MKKSQESRRGMFRMAALFLLVAGVILTVITLNKRATDSATSTAATQREAVSAEVSDTSAARVRTEREEPSITYESQDGRQKLKLVMDRIVTRDIHGQDEIVTLNPPATAATLRKRLAEYEAPLGVFPLAIDENDENGELLLITSKMRVEMSREDAQRLAGSKDLKIDDFPDYAPEWVVFEAAGPLDALDKVVAVRGDSSVLSADVILGRRYQLMDLPNDPLVDEQWHLKRSGAALEGTDINVEEAWGYPGTEGVLGRGVRIGVLDDGTQTDHPDYVGNMDTAIDRDFAAGDNDPNPPPGSEDNHGTAVAGLSAARGNNNLGVTGSAPEATIVGLRILGGFATDKDIADALAHRSDVIQVKNNSWGYIFPYVPLDPLMRAALKNSSENGRQGKGTIFAFAAGNDGDIEDSANFSELTSNIYTIAVGAYDSLGRRAFYSETGANLVITAPSHGFLGALGMVTTDRTGSDGYDKRGGAAGDYTDGFNGTSASCPVVSGVIALMLEKNPDLGWRDVQEILIRTAAKVNPSEPGWLTNAAGLNFNNDYGAGLIDATAAVNLAADWTNLEPQVSAISTLTDIGTQIPDNSSAGATVVFPLPTSNITTEHVTVRLTVDHTARGDLEISLFSPSGTESVLAFRRGDNGDDYDDHLFCTVQNWGENSSGDWTLKIADRRSGANTNGGSIVSAELIVYGAQAPPVNPEPIVRITSPGSGSVFSPGVGFTVNVDAQDFNEDGTEGAPTKVELYENDVLVGTDTTAPYSFPRNPANNLYSYVAKATDPEGLVGSSMPVFVTVKNQTPVINSVTLNAASQAYDDLPLTVTAVDATDPENDPITLAYKWEYSTDEDNYTDSGVTAATLPSNPANSGRLWRCVITATDGNSTSEPFVTGPVNLLDRPSSFAVRPGGTYSYQSGLVLRGDTLTIDRQAIIHEFSQGPGGGRSEWIEILTLQEGSLAGWTLSDNSGGAVSGGNTLTFAQEPWVDVPAGTLIVIYNGLEPKDAQLPADSTDLSSGAVVISSTNSTYFAETSKWPALDNFGDAVALANDSAETVHDLSYGNTLFPFPHIRRVAASESAYFAGRTDAGADQVGEWLVTNSNFARTSAFTAATVPPEAFSIFPGAVFTNGRYVQDFNAVPGVLGTRFPTGWSSYSVDFSVTQTLNYDQLALLQTAGSGGASFNFGSRIGMIANANSGGLKRFDPGFIALAIDNTRGLTGLQISYDIIKISEQTRDMELNLEYTTGNPANTGTQWTPVGGGTHRSRNTPTGSVRRINNLSLPAIFEDRLSPIYLRWYYRTSPGSQGTGLPDALAIDNLIISSDASPNIYLTLELDPDTVSEIDGDAASTATVTINGPVSYDLEVGISSSDITEATAPASIIIPAGQLSGTFPIRAVDDNFSDGVQSSTITLSATGFLNVSKVLTVLDDEPILVGVTPGLPNNPGNDNFVDRLRTDRIYEAPAYFISATTPLPDGLSIDSATGIISGTVSPTAPLGLYPVTIGIRNVLGGFSSQSIVIEVSDTPFSSYSQWIDQFGDIDKGIHGNSDFDDLPNLVEYVLGSRPDQFEQPSPVVSARTSDAMSITYKKSKDVTDVTLTVEWSPDLTEDSWETDGVLHEVLLDEVDSQTIRSSVTIDPTKPARFMRLKAVGPPQ